MRENMLHLLGAGAVAFAVTAAGGPFLIPFLRRLKCGQTVRDDGPATHLQKSGTPTMGGVLFLLGVVAATVLFAPREPEVILVLFMMLGFGLVGFIDDYIKVVCRRSMGLRAWQKLLLQMLVTACFAAYLIYYTEVPLQMVLPGTEEIVLNLGRGKLFVLFFIVLGTTNGINLTDGLDGLAGSVTAIVALFFALTAAFAGSAVAPVACAVTGALFGFLLFNAHPAAVFMGDTGSLALGGFVAACGYILEVPLMIAVVGLVYVVETLSVILQVVYFKCSGGKRLFRMAPFHHHLELMGWSEEQIVALFTLLTALMCLLAWFWM